MLLQDYNCLATIACCAVSGNSRGSAVRYPNPMTRSNQPQIPQAEVFRMANERILSRMTTGRGSRGMGRGGRGGSTGRGAWGGFSGGAESTRGRGGGRGAWRGGRGGGNPGTNWPQKKGGPSNQQPINVMA